MPGFPGTAKTTVRKVASTLSCFVYLLAIMPRVYAMAIDSYRNN